MVHRNGGPGAFGDWEGFQETEGFMPGGFCSGTFVASPDIVGDVFVYPRPKIRPVDKLNRFSDAGMTSE